MDALTAVKALSALAQESRLAVFRLVIQAGESGMAAGEIAQKLAIAPATLSFHLKELVHANLLDSRKQGRSVFYSPNPCVIRELLGFLTEDCCGGMPELCQPATDSSTTSCGEG